MRRRSSFLLKMFTYEKNTEASILNTEGIQDARIRKRHERQGSGIKDVAFDCFDLVCS
jgi:hypothetical protein